MNDKVKVTTELKSIVKDLKICNAGLALESYILVEKIMAGDVKGTLISLGLMSALGFIVHCSNKEFNESISEIDKLSDENLDDFDTKVETNNVNNGKIYRKVSNPREL